MPVLSAALYRALQLSRRSRFSGQAALGDALRVRRSSGESRRQISAREEEDSYEQFPLRRPGLLRRDRRSGLQEDLPGAAGDGEAGQSQRAGDRRRQGRLEPRPASGAGAGQPREARRSRSARRSTSCPVCCVMWMATTKTPRLFKRSAKNSARPSGRRTTSPFRRCCSGRSSNNSGNPGCARIARVIVEKPFGTDLASARKLNRILLATFQEPAIFRIDHYPREAAGP